MEVESGMIDKRSNWVVPSWMEALPSDLTHCVQFI